MLLSSADHEREGHQKKRTKSVDDAHVKRVVLLQLINLKLVVLAVALNPYLRAGTESTERICDFLNRPGLDLCRGSWKGYDRGRWWATVASSEVDAFEARGEDGRRGEAAATAVESVLWSG